MNTNINLSKAGVAIAAAIGVTAIGVSGLTQAAGNPFSAQLLDHGYMFADAGTKAVDGKCGATKPKPKSADGKCGGTKAGATEGKCGEGQAKPKAADGKCGEGKCANKK